jgi:hypothetical protein
LSVWTLPRSQAFSAAPGKGGVRGSAPPGKPRSGRIPCIFSSWVSESEPLGRESHARVSAELR